MPKALRTKPRFRSTMNDDGLPPMHVDAAEAQRLQDAADARARADAEISVHVRAQCKG